jgi:hypothetical protein
MALDHSTDYIKHDSKQARVVTVNHIYYSFSFWGETRGSAGTMAGHGMGEVMGGN